MSVCYVMKAMMKNWDQLFIRRNSHGVFLSNSRTWIEILSSFSFKKTKEFSSKTTRDIYLILVLLLKCETTQMIKIGSPYRYS